MADNKRMDAFLRRLLKGTRKKYLIAALSAISAIILTCAFVQPFIVINNLEKKNDIGIDTVDFTVNNLPNGTSEHIIGYLYRTNDAVNQSMNFTNPQPASAPGVLLLHGFGDGLGKEMMGKYAIELARRGFIVLSIDLPSQGFTTGAVPNFVPEADFDPYVIQGAIQYLENQIIVNKSAIGIVGFSYGATEAAMSAGVLGNLINATVAINGFMNFTDWLIQDILPNLNITFSVSPDKITLEQYNGHPISTSDINDLFRLYRLWRGNSSMIERLLIPGTTALNRTELSKLDAVNYLANATPNSLMFIHGINDATFGYTNQSMLGYNASTNGAVYIPVKGEHDLSGSNNAMWAMINFLKQKLMGIQLNGTGSEFEKYTTPTDKLGFTSSEFFNGNEFWYTIGFILLAMLPIYFIVNIIFVSKRYETKRSEEVYPEDEQELRIGGGSYRKVSLGVFCMFLVTGVILGTVGGGLDNPTLMFVMLPLFYISFYFSLVYVHDRAEIQKLQGITDEMYELKYNREQGSGFSFSNTQRTLIIIISGIIMIGLSLITGFLTPINIKDNLPAAGIIFALQFIGMLLVISAILFVWYLIRKSSGQLTWSSFKLDKYSLSKGLVFGTAVGLNFIVLYNIVAFNLKYPFLLGARSFYFALVLLDMIILSIGIYLWTSTILGKMIRIGKNRWGKIVSWIITTIIGIGFCFISGTLVAIRIANFGVWFNASMFVGLIFGGMYLLARILELFSVQKGTIAISIWMPIIFVAVAGFFLGF